MGKLVQFCRTKSSAEVKAGTVSDGVLTVGDNTFSDGVIFLCTDGGVYLFDGTTVNCVAGGEVNKDLLDIHAVEQGGKRNNVLLMEYDVTSTSEATKLFVNTLTITGRRIYVDGVRVAVVDDKGSIYYKFSTIGKHRVAAVGDTSVTRIEVGTFNDCGSLTSVTIPDSVTKIDGYVFSNCNRLTSIVIPYGVRDVCGNMLFGASVTDIEIKANRPDLLGSLSTGSSRKANLTLSQACVRTYTDLYGGRYTFIHDCGSRIQTGAIVLDNTVKNIGYCCFEKWQFDSITFPDGLKRIEESAFCNASSGTTVVIPDTVEYIGKTAFEGFTNLPADLVIPECVKYIGEGAFRSTAITSVTIPDGVRVADKAFDGCSSLASVTIGKGVVLEGSLPSTFYNCQLASLTIDSDFVSSDGKKRYTSTLTSLIIGSHVTTIVSQAFQGCSSLTSVVIPDGVTSIGSSAFEGCIGLTSVAISNSVTSIGNKAFKSCGGLTSVSFSDGVTSIGIEAFYGCHGLTSVSFPESVTSIGDVAFGGCSMTSVSIGKNVQSFGNNVFIGCSQINSVHVDMRSIPSYAFRYITNNLKSITFGDNVEVIGDCAFGGCSALTNLQLPKNVREIGNEAFSGCSSITSLAIPYSLQKVGNQAFANGTNITGLYIPDTLRSIGGGAFTVCSISAATVYCDNFLSCFPACTIDMLTISAGKSRKIVNGFAKNFGGTVSALFIDGRINEIGDEAFSGFSKLTHINLPPSISKIGASSFEGCTGLTSISIPAATTYIGESAFKGCTSLTSLTIHEETSIALDAFAECSNIAVTTTQACWDANSSMFGYNPTFIDISTVNE